MAQHTHIVGDGVGGQEREAHVHNRGIHSGVVVFTTSLFENTTEVLPLLNPTFGADMNQNISFGTISSIIHDGGSSSSAKTGTATSQTDNHLIDSGLGFNATVVVGMSVHNTTDDTYANVTAVADGDLTLDSNIFDTGNEAYIINAVWAGTAVAGAWNFADSAKVTLTAGNDGDEASFDSDPVPVWDMDNFTAFTGKIDLDTYNGITHSLLISFSLGGTIVGNTVDLNDYIDTGDLAEQSFVIPKIDLGLSSQTVNGLTVQLIRTGGAKPTFKLDDLHLEASGTPATFAYQSPSKDVFMTDIQATFVDDVTEANAKDYNSILGISALANGIVVTAISKGKSVFSGSFSRLIDFLQVPSHTFTVGGDATNSWVTINFNFRNFPVILENNGIDGVFWTINDDLSSLLFFRVFVKVSTNIGP